jgi:regulatory protein
MINITEIKRLRGNKYLIKAIQKDKETTHIVPEDTILKYNLLNPKNITLKEYKQMITSSETDLLYQKALHFIDFKMRTISEVKKHLRKTTKDETNINNLITKLKKQGYLNDDQYVQQYVTEKIEFDLVGPKYIKEKLISKGIHFDLIDQHLIRYSDEYQYDKIRDLIVKETKYPIKKAYIKAYQSLKAKLINKGFTISIIESSMLSSKDLLEEAVNEAPLLQKELDKLLKDYDVSDYKQKDKVIKKLLSKGFRYDVIKEMLQ